jgi:hypothetical protein
LESGVFLLVPSSDWVEGCEELLEEEIVGVILGIGLIGWI